MPLYEYECENGHRFELIRKFSDPPLEKCPQCGSPVHKLMSAPAIQFKGIGWYITDYARKGTTDTRETKDTKGGKDTKDSKETKDASGSKSDTSSSTTEGSSTKTSTDSKTEPPTASAKND